MKCDSSYCDNNAVHLCSDGLLYCDECADALASSGEFSWLEDFAVIAAPQNTVEAGEQQARQHKIAAEMEGTVASHEKIGCDIRRCDVAKWARQLRALG